MVGYTDGRVIFDCYMDQSPKNETSDDIRLKFLTGKGTEYCEINVLERVQVIEHVGGYKCQGLIGLPNTSGADWGGLVETISKKMWVGAYLKLVEADPSINCFKELGD